MQVWAQAHGTHWSYYSCSPASPPPQLTFDTRESHFTSESLGTYRACTQRKPHGWMSVPSLGRDGHAHGYMHTSTHTYLLGTHMHRHTPWGKSQGLLFMVSSHVPTTSSWTRFLVPAIPRPRHENPSWGPWQRRWTAG